MQQMNRILAVCNEYEKCDGLIDTVAKMAKGHGAGVTLMYVHEVSLFELPFFNKEEGLEHQKLRRELEERAVAAGIEEPAILIFEDDTADHVAEEAGKEADTLIVTTYAGKPTQKILRKISTPVLVIKEAIHLYTKAVVALDAVMPERCLNFMQRFFKGVDLHLYQDFQYIPLPSVDPVVEPFDVGMDASIYLELMSAKQEAFQEFCKERGLKGTFETGENGIDEDTVAFVKKVDADLLVLAPLDRDTMLGDAIEDIVEKSPVDTLVCYEHQG
ncbi:MAG TPA: universal stress protein [Campylobacteraceae bacterium]|nr:universal stress protein [Campylobacteraceae bacterium]